MAKESKAEKSFKDEMLQQELESIQTYEGFEKEKYATEAVQNRVEVDPTIMAAVPNMGLNGQRSLAETLALIDHNYLHRNNEPLFAKPELYMREPLKGCKYVWASIKDPHMRSRIRSRKYRRVEKHEIREDTELPIDFKEVAGKEQVQVGDLVLCEVNPLAVKELYSDRAYEGLLNSQNNIAYSQLEDGIAKFVGQDNIDSGAVRTEMDKSLTRE
jgi:hypothetical protein